MEEHEEGCTCDGTASLEGVMFLVGAQTTPDGDMLPSSFTVIPVTQDPADAIHRIMHKIVDDLQDLNIDFGESMGSLEVRRIYTWQEWADIPILPEVKMKAFVEAINESFLETLLSSHTTAEIVAFPWMPQAAREAAED